MNKIHERPFTKTPFFVFLILSVIFCGFVNAQVNVTTNQNNSVEAPTILPRQIPVELTAEQYVSKAVKERSAGENQKAIIDYKKAIELDARYTPAYKGLGNLY